MKGTKVLTLDALGSLIPMLKDTSSYDNVYEYADAWITILLGWALEPSFACYSQKRHGL